MKKRTNEKGIVVYKKISDFQSNKTNPFISETIMHIEKHDKIIAITQKDHDLIISQDGEVRGHAMLAVKKRVDKAQFMKFYFSSLSSLYELSRASLRVFIYMAEKIKDTPNSDFIMIDFDNIVAETKYSRKTITTGISELIENKFIARGPNPYIYFLNPTIFFNGDRISLLQEYELQSTKELSN